MIAPKGRPMRRLTTLACTLTLALAGMAQAVPFSDWAEQRFAMFSSNDWTQGSGSVGVTSDGTVSMLWTQMPPSDGATRNASWSWSVTRSVVPTALDEKGGDDRNLSLYFVFMPPEIAEVNRTAGIRKLLSIEEARVLMYVWGGNYPRGAIVRSPYLGERGRTIALRPAGTGNFTEQVDLAADYTRAFGGEAGELVGMALSSDSDDTNGQISAQLSDLRLR
jgi:hypothetical protein